MRSSTSTLRLLLPLVIIATILSSPTSGPTAQVYSASQLNQAGQGAGDWPMYGHDPAHTSYNPNETLISFSNVDRLVARWTSPALGYNGHATSRAPSGANRQGNSGR